MAFSKGKREDLKPVVLGVVVAKEETQFQSRNGDGMVGEGQLFT